jgi:hypothetical protein
MQSVLEALAERRYELLVSVMIAGMLILTAATLLYFVKGGCSRRLSAAFRGRCGGRW